MRRFFYSVENMSFLFHQMSITGPGEDINEPSMYQLLLNNDMPIKYFNRLQNITKDKRIKRLKE